MADLMLTCDICRHRMRVSEFQLGMEIVCPNCKAELAISTANTVPLEPKEPTYEYEPFAAKTKEERAAKEHGVERCERCDAVIRGDWDRYETDAGTWCNRCVNRVRTEDEEEVRVIRRGGAEAAAAMGVSAGPGPEYVIPHGVDDTPMRPEDILRQHTEKARAEWEAKQPKDERPAFMREYPRATKAAMWCMIAFVFFATAYYFFIVPESGTQVIERDSDIVQAMNRAPLGVRMGMQLGFWFLATVLPLYLTLYLVNKLPTGAVLNDVIHVTLLSLLLALLAWFLSMVPVLGTLLYVFLAIMILWSTYEMNLSDYITWLLMAFILRYLVLWPLESRILYGVGQAMS